MFFFSKFIIIYGGGGGQGFLDPLQTFIVLTTYFDPNGKIIKNSDSKFQIMPTLTQIIRDKPWPLLPLKKKY